MKHEIVIRMLKEIVEMLNEIIESLKNMPDTTSETVADTNEKSLTQNEVWNQEEYNRLLQFIDEDLNALRNQCVNTATAKDYMELKQVYDEYEARYNAVRTAYQNYKMIKTNEENRIALLNKKSILYEYVVDDRLIAEAYNRFVHEQEALHRSFPVKPNKPDVDEIHDRNIGTFADMDADELIKEAHILNIDDKFIEAYKISKAYAEEYWQRESNPNKNNNDDIEIVFEPSKGKGKSR